MEFWLCQMPYSSTAVELPPQKACYSYLRWDFGRFVGCVFWVTSVALPEFAASRQAQNLLLVACGAAPFPPFAAVRGSGMSLRRRSRCFAPFAPVSVPLPSLLSFALSGRYPRHPLSLATLAPFSCCISLRFSLALLCVYSCKLFFVKKGCHAVIYGRLA